MQLTDLARVPGVPESSLAPELLSRLPESAPGAPWECQAQAVIWTGRGGKAAAQALPPRIREAVSALNVVGGMVRYQDTPVGSYDEVFGNIGFRHGRKIRSSVAFMAVDSETSLIGGRSNWAMPKTLAHFEGDPAAGVTMSAAGQTWRVRATPKALGPAVPMATSFTVIQQWPDGQVRHAPMRVRGRARPALVTVEVEAGPTLAGWLRPGRHLGAIFETVTFTLGSPYAGRNFS